MYEMTGDEAQQLGLQWQKSFHSNPNGACVEVAALPDGGVAVRHSKNPGGHALLYTRQEFVAFIGGAKDGQFDHLVS